MLESTDTRTAWICTTCGVQTELAHNPPTHCPICADERQYVGWSGQQWLSPAELNATHRIEFADECGVTTMHQIPGFAINQRAFLIPTGRGNIMWECLSVITDEAVTEIAQRGGVQAIAISHPHFYAAAVDWSAALGGVPIYVHEADRVWFARPSDCVNFWQGRSYSIADNIELVHLGGHFAGSAGLWWKTGPREGGSLFPGDSIQVVMDRRYASFMYSYPNAIPLGPDALAALQQRTERLTFEDVYGYSRGRQIIGGARQAIDASFARYQTALAA